MRRTISSGKQSGLRRSWVDRHARIVAMFATLASVVVLVSTVLVLSSGRQEAITRARNTSANVVGALARDLGRNLEVYDLSLQAVVDGMSNPEVPGLPAQLRHEILFDRSTTAAYISGIYAVDDKGRVVQARARLLPKADFSDRDYFTVHRDNANVGLFISRPYASRLRNGTPSIALSRRISKDDGTFGGIALIAINLGYFQQLVDDIKPGHEGIAAIMQTDGFIVARNPRLSTGDNKARVVSAPEFMKKLTANSGSFDAQSPLDGVMRTFTYARVQGSNLIVVVGPAIDDVTAEWKHRSLIIGTLVIVVSAAFTVVVWLLVFAVRQRDAAQARLVTIANTDALTGVSNRRRLDSGLDDLWASARRSGATVALLFVDADHFKRYNDTHGHDVGDRALQHVADCLSKHARRGGDLVARYGGEEFFVALADCDESYAAHIAEAVRQEVAGPVDEIRRIELPQVTVSIGFIVCRPADGVDLEDMKRLADEALYKSKTEGRNRVTAATFADLLKEVER